MTTAPSPAQPADPLATLRAEVHGHADPRSILSAFRALPEARRKLADALERFAFKVRSALGKTARDPLSAPFVVENAGRSSA